MLPTEDQLEHPPTNIHIISSLIDSIPAINGPSKLLSEQSVSANLNAKSLIGSFNDCAHSVNAGHKVYCFEAMDASEIDMYDLAQPSVISMPQYPVDSPKLALHKKHMIESGSATEEMPCKTKNSLASHTRNTNYRYSTGSLTLKRFPSFSSIRRLGPANNSLRPAETPSLDDAFHKQATRSKSRSYKRGESLSEGIDSSHRYPWMSSLAERKCSSHNTVSPELPAHLDKTRESGSEHEDRILGLKRVSKADDEREKISADVIPDRRSSLRHQNLSAEQSRLHRSSLIGTRAEHDTLSTYPTDLLDSGKKINNSCLPIDFDDKVVKCALEFKKLDKKRSSDCAYNSLEDGFTNQSTQTQRQSSQTIIIAEEKDRINKAYNHLRLSSIKLEQSKDPSKSVADTNDTPNLVAPLKRLSQSTDTVCDTLSLKNVFEAIEDTPNLSLDVMQFDTMNAEENNLLISKRKSARRTSRSQQQDDKGREKSSTADFDRSKLFRSKRLSHLKMESLTSLTRRSQSQCADKDIDQDIKSFLAAQRLSQTVRHPRSGRKISFSEVGDPKGHAVLCCVGMGLTRFGTVFYDDLARTLHLRLITPDRPGVGNSDKDQDNDGMPLNWSEDVLAICSHLRITKFSILAHSAGAIYALATALRVPQHVEGRIHLLAPWITPSQLKEAGTLIGTSTGGQLPRSQRILKALPAQLLKVANTSFMSATSSSIIRTASDTTQHIKSQGYSASQSPMYSLPLLNVDGGYRNDILHVDRIDFSEYGGSSNTSANRSNLRNEEAETKYQELNGNRQSQFGMRLTLAIWDAATINANPAVDLLVCLERYQPIGFRYTDVDLPVVIHHGAQDTRVPVENARWLGGKMRNCEMCIIEDEGHGLMASATVMGEVLTDVAKDWRNHSLK